MITLVRWFSFLIVIQSLSGCNTLESKGDDLFEQGEFLKSAEYYEKALEKDPSDAEISAKLTSARLMVIDRKLIEVRQHRMSGNWEEGLLVFAKIIAWENDWKIAPKGNVAFTQKEEFQLYNIEIAQKIFKKLDENHPFDAYDLFKTSKFLFEQSNKKENILSSILAQGKKFCEVKFQEVGSSNVFYASFLNDRCTKIFSSSSKKLADYAVKIQDQLYSRPKIKFNSLHLNVGSIESLESEIANAFVNSAWFHLEGKLESTIQSNALIDIRHREWTTPHVHVYYEDEKYIVYEDRTVNKEVFCSHCVGGRTTVRSTESVPVEKKRSVRREQPYTMFHHEGNFQADISGNLNLGSSQSLPFAVTDKQTLNESNDSRRHPTFPQFSMTDNMFFGKTLLSLNQKIKQTLNSEYVRQVCEYSETIKTSQLLEVASKCARAGTPSSEERTAPVFEREFGITHQRLMAL